MRDASQLATRRHLSYWSPTVPKLWLHRWKHLRSLSRNHIRNNSLWSSSLQMDSRCHFLAGQRPHLRHSQHHHLPLSNQRSRRKCSTIHSLRANFGQSRIFWSSHLYLLRLRLRFDLHALYFVDLYRVWMVLALCFLQFAWKLRQQPGSNR